VKVSGEEGRMRKHAYCDVQADEVEVRGRTVLEWDLPARVLRVVSLVTRG
jgi:hypothetical protein